MACVGCITRLDFTMPPFLLSAVSVTAVLTCDAFIPCQICTSLYMHQIDIFLHCFMCCTVSLLVAF